MAALMRVKADVVDGCTSNEAPGAMAIVVAAIGRGGKEEGRRERFGVVLCGEDDGEECSRGSVRALDGEVAGDWEDVAGGKGWPGIKSEKGMGAEEATWCGSEDDCPFGVAAIVEP